MTSFLFFNIKNYLKALEFGKTLPHPSALHSKLFSVTWESWWIRRALAPLNVLLHIVHNTLGFFGSEIKSNKNTSVKITSIKKKQDFLLFHNHHPTFSKDSTKILTFAFVCGQVLFKFIHSVERFDANHTFMLLRQVISMFAQMGIVGSSPYICFTTNFTNKSFCVWNKVPN